VALARALANDPPIVLADEPTGNLDSTNGRHIMELLRNIHATRKTTIVLVTHDVELAALADARLVLRDGRVVERTGVNVEGAQLASRVGADLAPPSAADQSDDARTERARPLRA
jgi:ABC-type methionine transport system ATPase subunit